MSRHHTFIAAFAIVAAAPATAATIDLAITPTSYTFASYDASGTQIAGNVITEGNGIRNNGVAFYTATRTFNFPTGATNATLSVKNFAVDDRAVALLNGVQFLANGLYAASTGTVGSFQYQPTGGSTPVTFFTGVDFSAANLVAGANTLTFIVNNTNNGIYTDDRSTGQSALLGDVSVTFDAAGAVPEPTAWALMISGFGAVGFAARRRRATVRVAFA